MEQTEIKEKSNDEKNATFDFNSLLLLEYNSKCNDCGIEKPKYVSTNNGVFLCERCSLVHRTYGLNISVIRSIEKDNWNELQFLFLKKGGNENFRKFIYEYFFPLNTSTYDIYRSNALDYYRKKLRNEVNLEINKEYKEEENIKPDNKTGIFIIPDSAIIYYNYNNDLIGNFSSCIPKNENIYQKFSGTLYSFSNKVNSKMNEFGIPEKTRKVGNYIVTNKYVQKISEGSKKVYNSFIDKVIKRNKKKNENEDKKDTHQVLVDIGPIDNTEEKKEEKNNNENNEYSKVESINSSTSLAESD